MRVCGVDEAGRGPLAGPVVAAAVVFPAGYQNPAITDSKKLSAKKRAALVPIIQRDALDFAVVAVGHHRILQLNILGAALHAMALAVQRVECDMVLIDGDKTIATHLPQRAIIGGDALQVEISAASILAKEWRDHLMRILDAKYSGYDFSTHAGYPTKAHRAAIAQLGPSPVHRRAFAGVREYLLATKSAGINTTSAGAA